jgi:hypothetical protein
LRLVGLAPDVIETEDDGPPLRCILDKASTFHAASPLKVFIGAGTKEDEDFVEGHMLPNAHELVARLRNHASAVDGAHTESNYNEPICPRVVRDGEYVARKPRSGVTLHRLIGSSVSTQINENRSQAGDIQIF